MSTGKSFITVGRSKYHSHHGRRVFVATFNTNLPFNVHSVPTGGEKYVGIEYISLAVAKENSQTYQYHASGNIGLLFQYTEIKFDAQQK